MQISCNNHAHVLALRLRPRMPMPQVIANENKINKKNSSRRKRWCKREKVNFMAFPAVDFFWTFALRSTPE